MPASDWRAVWYLEGPGAERQPAKVTMIHGMDGGNMVSVQLGDGTHRYLLPFVDEGPSPNRDYAIPGPDVNLDDLEASISLSKRVPGSDDDGA